MARKNIQKNFSLKRHQLKISTVSTVEAIKGLESDWRSLEQSADNDMALFQSFDWVLQWCKVWHNTSSDGKSRHEPYIVTIWQKDKLVSIWPLQRDSVAGVSSLSWLSSPALQYGDALIDTSSDPDEICAVAWEHIISADGADLLRFDNVAATSPIYEFLSHHCATSAHSKSSILEVGSFADWAAYQASVKKTARRARRKRYNKLARTGELTFNVRQSPEKFRHLVDVAIDWKCLWLEQQHWPNTLMSEPLFKVFLQNVGDSSLEENSKATWVAGELCLDGKPIALEIGAVYANRYFSFLGAFNDEFAKFSPGKIEMEAMIGWAMEQGIADFDFLCVPSQYKSDWTDTSIPVRSFSYSCNVRGKLFHSVWLKRLRPAMKYGLHHIPQSQRKFLVGLFSRQFGPDHGNKGQN